MTISFIQAAAVYFLKVILASGLLFAYYRVLLYNRRCHQFNRVFLLSIPLLSLLMPLIPLPFAHSVWPANLAAHMTANPSDIKEGIWNETDAMSNAARGLTHLFTWQALTTLAYLTVSLLLLYAFFCQLRYIRRLTKRYPGEKLNDIHFFGTHEPGTPFSFLNLIFWNDEMDRHSDAGKQIFRHELNHVRQRHSFDLLLLKLLIIPCWINPFFHLIYREIRAVHEFLADDEAVSEGDRYRYAESLVWQSVHTPPATLLHSFFQSPVKRRIIMITQLKNARTTLPGRAMILPLLFLLFCAFGTKQHTPRIDTAAQPLTVVIDAGHGGIDPGAINKEGVQEKNINLSIAEKIKNLAGEYNVRILMTRESDELAGGKPTKEESLEYRAKMANDNKADVFLSIHTDMDASPYVKGFNIFVAEQNAHYAQCVQLGSAIIENLKKSYPPETALKKRKQHIYVLGYTNMPAVLLECGNMDNGKDLSFIRNEENQVKIARDILEGIRTYAAGANK